MARLTRKESSAGGVVYEKSNNAVKALLIARNAKKTWCLPKGKIELNETPEQAAVREIKEETGIDAKIIKLLGDIHYKFISPEDSALVIKDVRFFLFCYAGGDITPQKIEVDDAGWFDINAAINMMSYPSEKKIMELAKKEISGL